MKVEIDDKALQIISSALGIYSRMQTGQFRIALEEAFPEQRWNIDLEDVNMLENEIQNLMIPDLVDGPPKDRNCGDLDDEGCVTHKKEPRTFSQNKYRGIFQTNEDSQKAWSIKKVIDEYLSVKGNDGYYGFGVNFQGPMEPCHSSFRLLNTYWKFKNFYIFEDQEEIGTMVDNTNDHDWETIWAYVDKIYPKEDRPFYGYSSMEIKKDHNEEFMLVVNKPLAK